MYLRLFDFYKGDYYCLRGVSWSYFVISLSYSMPSIQYNIIICINFVICDMNLLYYVQVE